MKEPTPSARLPLWKLELEREQALRRRNNAKSAYLQAELELKELDERIQQRRKEA